MTPETIAALGQQAMTVTMQISAPMLLVALAVGLVIALFQAATQINEMTLTFVPKLIAMAIVLMLAGPWMLQLLIDYTRSLIRSIPSLIG
ncbi:MULTISPECIES: flagellar biosynthesis protein FliQ [Methylocaldum]|jgi:flagellar biosynthetic protein FliQ|uniref:flagellar biosynthesis protein FliQ n=1 Tax=unclassified Methylocaldum TaxID=2622260 RepID=UPI00098A82DA|nr:MULTISPECIES: flagellar biosynthesis protein FliQ [unclassified Methylocaldum]MBP1149593.1 flagellar biosynthetic protein FliQ [Methylocaldum sp. RMAD-M]MVF20901.1 flagellar biosynthesis protein FliQ [Methylocaldum sp. BRCS4]